MNTPIHVPLGQLRSSPVNPRQVFDDQELAGLAQSIKQHGILQPVIVRPAEGGAPGQFEIVAGERRVRAAQAAGLAEVPAIVRKLTDVEAREVAAIENLQRTDLEAIDEAEGYDQLIRCGGTVATIAERLGRSPAYVYDRLKLLALVEDARQLLHAHVITTGHAVILARLKPEDQRRALSRGDEDSLALGGLWSRERLLLDPEDDVVDEDHPERLGAGHILTRFGEALKPVSTRELQAWVDKHVRLPAEEADAVLFPELAETAAVAAAGTEKVVRITHEQITPEDAKGNGPKLILGRSWKRADGTHGSKTCEHSVIGTIELGPGRGEVLRVCVDKKRCNVHWGEEIKARKKREKEIATSGTKGEDREALRRRKETEEEAKRKAAEERWQAAEPAILTALAAAVKKGPAGASSAAGKLLREYTEDTLWLPNPLLASRKLVPQGKTAEDLVRHLVFGILCRDVEDQTRDHFISEAKAFGVDVKKIVDKAQPAPVRKCRKCGCTEDKACPGGCGWAKEPDPKTGLGLCTVCAPAKGKKTTRKR